MSASGNYPIRQSPGEMRRLRMQADAMAFDAGVMLDRIGVRPGWRCLDLGCGVGGIIDLLSERVGPAGRVVGLDTDALTLEAARAWVAQLRLTNVELVEGDAYRTGLPRASFDLVHVRFLMSTAGESDALLREAYALVGSGGVLAVEEPDIDTLNCYPFHWAWHRLKQVLAQAFTAIGGDVHLARTLYAAMRAAGLENLEYRPFLVGVKSTDPFVDYLPQTIESIRQTIVGHAIATDTELDDAIAQCRRHLADPDTVFNSYLVAQVWGRKPGG